MKLQKPIVFKLHVLKLKKLIFLISIFKIINDFTEYYPDQSTQISTSLSTIQIPVATVLLVHLVPLFQCQSLLAVFSFCQALGNPNIESMDTWVIHE